MWKSCDELRGGMDASQYKDYVLVLLFVKYVSDKYGGRKDAPIEVPKGGSFNDMVALKGKPEIGEGINKIIAKLAEANDLKGIIDVADFNDSDKLGSGKAMQDRLSNLIGIFQNDALDLSKNKAEGDDLLGDAYEYLMRYFATESGKSKGQFYTPSEVSRVIAKVIGISGAKRKDWTVYDPTCGSGSLLLKAAYETPQGITIYGQEKDVATRALAVINMWLHGNPEADIKREDSISNPLFRNHDGGLKTFDFVVANPPFSTKSWSHGIDPMHDEFGRFDGYGIPPRKNGDYAFLLHIIKSLKSTGKGAVVLPHGVLFRGNAEADIRKSVIKRGYIKGIIGLPSNLFYGTGIPACIIVIDKENSESRKGIFMIDASKGFYKDGNKNRLRSRDIHKIVDVFTKQIEIPKYSRMVSISEIADEKNDYNLNIPRYIDSQEEEDMQDIDGHLKGGIPDSDINALNEYWKVYPKIRSILFTQSRKKYSNLCVDKSEIKTTIFSHPEFNQYVQQIERIFVRWKKKHLPMLKGITIGVKPREIISVISESLLDDFSNTELIDKYDIYQLLMTYWEETMQDDVFILGMNGWKVDIYPIKNKKEKEVGWNSDLLPKNIVIAKYFAKQKELLDEVQAKIEEVEQKMQEMDEENQGDDDIFSEARSSSDKITKGEIVKRIKDIKNDSEFVDEFKALSEYLELIQKEAELKKRLREMEIKLDKELLTKYKSLTEEELKILVIENKWMTALDNSVKSEMEGLSQKLASRIKELAERYETPLPFIVGGVSSIEKKVRDHLENMGFKW